MMTSSAVEFVEALRDLRLWAGQPSLRRLRDLGGTVQSGTASVGGIDVLAESTTSYTLRGARVPRAEFVRAFAGACLNFRGLGEEQVVDWVEQWHEAWLSVTRSDDATDRNTYYPLHTHEAVVARVNAYG
jgi:hypothetical protein